MDLPIVVAFVREEDATALLLVDQVGVEGCTAHLFTSKSQERFQPQAGTSSIYMEETEPMVVLVVVLVSIFPALVVMVQVEAEVQRVAMEEICT